MGMDGSGSGSHVTAQAATGVANPFRSRVPSGVNWSGRPDPASKRTTSVTRICPPCAAAQSRAASITGVPKQSPSSKVTSPALVPIRISRGAALPPERLWRSSACWMATAAATASDAPENVAITPSPKFFTRHPRFASMEPERRWSCFRRISSAASSPSRARSSVDPTKSVKRTMAVDRPAPAPLPPTISRW